MTSSPYYGEGDTGGEVDKYHGDEGGMGCGDCFASLAMTRRGIRGEGVTRYFDY